MKESEEIKELIKKISLEKYIAQYEANIKR